MANPPTDANSTDRVLGTFCTLGVEALEMLARPPLGALLLDAQHGVWTLETLREGLRAAEACGVRPFIRLPVVGNWMIEGVLDAGCFDLIIPMVNSAQPVRDTVQACYYPPIGQRSQSTCRASIRFGPDYRKTFNNRLRLWVMIEHVDAVNQIDSIAAVPGLSGCFIGPSDLASSLGERTGELDTHIDRARAACQAAGKLTAITAPNVTKARQRFEQGFNAVFVSTDRHMLTQAIDAMGRE